MIVVIKHAISKEKADTVCVQIFQDSHKFKYLGVGSIRTREEVFKVEKFKLHYACKENRS